MKKTLVIIGVLILIPVGWILYGINKAKNYEFAYITQDASSYNIELRGVRYLMAHDPITALMFKTYEAKANYNVPRISGVIDGAEIPVQDGYYNLVGSITFIDGKISVDLAADNYDDGIKDPVSWNGVYEIVFKTR